MIEYLIKVEVVHKQITIRRVKTKKAGVACVNLFIRSVAFLLELVKSNHS